MFESASFSYLYRDASNYKKCGAVAFRNPEGVDVQTIERQLRSAFLTDATFVADQIRLPELFLYDEAAVTPDDHCLHEFHSLGITDQHPDDKHGRTLVEFLSEVEAASGAGWQGFYISKAGSRMHFKLAF